MEDFFTENNSIIEPHDVALRCHNRGAIKSLEWARAIVAIKNRIIPPYNGITGTSTAELPKKLYHPLNASIVTKDGTVELRNINYQKTINILTNANELESRRAARFRDEIGLNEDQVAQGYRDITKLSIDSATRAFNFRLINGLLYGNKDYYRFGFKGSPNCPHCDEEDQNAIHVLWDCPETECLRLELARDNLDLFLNKKDAIAGAQQKPIAFIALKLNQYLISKNYHDEPISKLGFKAYLFGQKSVESAIALANGKIETHNKKWSKINRLLP